MSRFFTLVVLALIFSASIIRSDEKRGNDLDTDIAKLKKDVWEGPAINSLNGKTTIQITQLAFQTDTTGVIKVRTSYGKKGGGVDVMSFTYKVIEFGEKKERVIVAKSSGMFPSGVVIPYKFTVQGIELRFGNVEKANDMLGEEANLTGVFKAVKPNEKR